MGENSKIAWTDATWTVTTGCQAVSSGCARCYAATMTKRLAAMGLPEYQGLLGDSGHFNGNVRLLPKNLDKPLHWKKPRMIFVDSMSDLFHEAVPFEFIDRVFAMMKRCGQHVFQVLTKRPERMAAYLQTLKIAWPLPNVWLGTSVENQTALDARWGHLRAYPAAIRFLSIEPLLGPLDLRAKWVQGWGTDDWIICGCESGPKRRPCEPEWIRSIVDQCAAAGVSCFVKQFPLARHRKGNPAPHAVSHDPAEWPEWARVRQFPEVSHA